MHACRMLCGSAVKAKCLSTTWTQAHAHQSGSTAWRFLLDKRCNKETGRTVKSMLLKYLSFCVGSKCGATWWKKNCSALHQLRFSWVKGGSRSKRYLSKAWKRLVFFEVMTMIIGAIAQKADKRLETT